MTLREWLDKQRPGAMLRLHDETGISYRSLIRYAHREKPRTPPLETAIALSKATRGAVKVGDLVQGTGADVVAVAAVASTVNAVGLVTEISMTGGADAEECAS